MSITQAGFCPHSQCLTSREISRARTIPHTLDSDKRGIGQPLRCAPSLQRFRGTGMTEQVYL